MVEHGSSVSKIKEILKNSKSVKKSDEILDDLFSSIKVEVKSSTSDDDGDNESNSDQSDGEEERRKKKKSKKKKKKKDKKLKKKKKRQKHSSESESEREEERSRSKRERREEHVDDSFWGGSKPYDENAGKELRMRSRERREPEYNDERRPVDMGRVARPYPDSRDMSYPPEQRSEYRREEWRREEYDREGGRGRREEYERERGNGRRREERGGRERKEYEREERRGGTVMREMSVASVASTVGGGKDGFWDTKWDAMKLDEKIQEEEKKGQYYLNTKKRFKQTMGEEEDEGTPSLSPSPEREKKERKKKKKEKEREEECDELKGIRKLADLQDNKVEGDGKVKGAVPDSKDYEYDRVTRMYKKKDEIVEKERVKKGFPEPEELKQPVDEEEEERIRLTAIEQDKNELCIKADLSNVDEIPLDVLLKAKRRVDSKHYHDPNIDASQVLNPRKAKLLNPSKAAMDKAFPRNEVKQRSEVVKKIAEMHREAQAKKAETKEEIMEELAKEIEELENEVGSSSSDSSDDEKTNKVTPEAPEVKQLPDAVPLEGKADEKEGEKSPEIGMKLDWGDSALAHLKEPEKTEAEKEEERKKEEELAKKLKEDAEKSKKLEDGEVDDGIEEGEVSSDEDRKKKKKKKRSRSKSRSRRSYSRRSRSRSRKRSRSRRRSYSRGRSPYDRKPSRRRSPSPYNRYGYSRKDLRDRSYSRERRDRRDRSRSRERRRQQEDERYERAKRAKEKLERSRLNKEKLLEIAKKNAAKILKSGGDYLGMDTERLIAMKSGGQSLDEITKFCKEISKKGLENEDKIDLLADSDSSEEEFQHPFMVKDKPLPNPIQMLVGEAREVLPPAARAVAKSQRMLEFPVSSGNAHRSKEGAAATPADPLGDWEPVKPQEPFKSQKEQEEMERFHDSVQQEEQALAKHGASGKKPVVTLEGQLREAMLKDGEGTNEWNTLPEETPDDFVKKMKPWTLAEADKEITKPKATIFKDKLKIFSEKDRKELDKLRPKKTVETDELGQLVVRPADELARNALELKIQLSLPTPKASTSAGAPAPVAISNRPDKVFDKFQEAVVDIGTIVSTRLNAMRKLQQNPNDADALADMYEAQKLMASWAQSKNKPGQFVGSTGATVLSKHELSLGLQCWAKPDQFTKAEKVSGGFGEYMLKKMGWTDGEGLGKHKSGEVNPLQLDIKFDKKGLMAAEEEGRRKGSAVATMTACKDLAGKHPVSALTELCSKRRWGPPIFTQAFECGPPHKKQYIIKVNVNGTEYMGSVAVNDKKKAKANAAMYCLQTMGLVPKDPDNPV